MGKKDAIKVELARYELDEKGNLVRKEKIAIKGDSDVKTNE